MVVYIKLSNFFSYFGPAWWNVYKEGRVFIQISQALYLSIYIFLRPGATGHVSFYASY